MSQTAKSQDFSAVCSTPHRDLSFHMAIPTQQGKDICPIDYSVLNCRKYMSIVLHFQLCYQVSLCIFIYFNLFVIVKRMLC